MTATTISKRRGSDPEWIGRLTLTLIVSCGALATIVCVSDALRASDQMVRLENSVVDLSQFVAGSHAAIREHVATRESIDDALTVFNAGVERRVAKIRETLKQPVGVSWWTGDLTAGLNLYRLTEDRREYVAAAVAASHPSGNAPLSLRRLDLFAQKLMVTVDAARDGIEPARAQARDDANAMVMLALGIGVLVVLYLVWLPVFDRARPSSVRLA